MDGISAAAILKTVAEYGVLGLGWVAWILTMFYVQTERRRYQALVFHIIQYFMKVPGTRGNDEIPDFGPHTKTFERLTRVEGNGKPPSDH